MKSRINFMLLLITLAVVLALSSSAQAFINKITIEKSFTHLEKTQYGKPLYIRIFKEEAVLEVWQRESATYSLLKTYPICYFSGTLGPKTKQGDKQAPEGFYRTNKGRLNPNSQYHLSFNLGYPNAYDKAQGYTGDYLMVHGRCVSIGCYAMTDVQITEIYALLEAAFAAGQKDVEVHIFPFKMTDKNMASHKSNKWYGFWEMIKPAYDSFESTRTVPKISVKDSKYIIE